MENSRFLDEITAKLNEAAANSPLKDFEKNARALLNQGMTRLNLVTREEFDLQSELLARTRQKVEELEARVAALEAAQKLK
jgi:BMFP domain-containing protein YqiC